MITVACVLRSGGLYDASWIEKLKRGVERNLSLPHKFVCLSDVDVPCERIELVKPWRGWWSKLELFRRGLFTGPVLYFDLDTVVVGSLDAIASYPHHFTMGHEYYRPQLLCSTAMAWNGNFSFIRDGMERHDAEAITNAYDKLLAGGRIGDQAFIEDCLKGRNVKVDTFRDLFGERSIASYKVHQCESGPPADAAVVSFHGFPKPHQLGGWVAEQWI